MKRKNIYFLAIACTILVTIYSGIKILKTQIGDSELSNKLNAVVEDGLKKDLFFRSRSAGFHKWYCKT